MTLLYKAAAQPGTHVLLIGVGKYPHLIGGGGPAAKNQFGLAQLDSPPVSAKAVADWCLAPLMPGGHAGYINASTPLSSVDALISAPTPVTIETPTGNPVADPATLLNIRQAFSAWRKRVAEHPDNIGIFYFCGHGLMGANHYLLAEDFGADHDQQWENAFDITTTRRAVERKVKGALYFFIDACREISVAKAVAPETNPQPLLDIEPTEPVIVKSSSLIWAAGENKEAFAAPGGNVSRFTTALLLALKGYCGDKVSGAQTWTVDGEILAKAVRKLLERGNRPRPGEDTPEPQLSEQSISGASVPLLRLTTVPNVMVELRMIPEAKRANYRLYLQSAQNGKRFEDNGEPVFERDVPRGFYEVGAQPKMPGIAGVPPWPEEEVMPPEYRPDPPLEVTA